MSLAAACVVGLGLAAKRPAEQFAATMALALADARATLPRLFDGLLALVKRDVDVESRQAALLALGLVGARSERTALLDLGIGAADPWLGYAAGDSLGCLADPRIVAPMAQALGSTRNDAGRGALARAPSEIGDRRAVEGLSALAFDVRQDDPTRERALAALGVMAQRSDVAWNAPLRHALFLGETTPTLQFVSELF